MKLLRGRTENGFAITTLLLIVGTASLVIVGGSKTGMAVYDQQITQEATSLQRGVANNIRDRGIAMGGDQGRALVERAQQMTEVATMLEDRAMDSVVTNVSGNLRDAVLLPLQGGKVITTVQYANDLILGYPGLVTDAKSAWSDDDPKLDEAIRALQELPSGSTTDFTQPVERAVAEMKVTATRNTISAANPDLSPQEVDDRLVETLVSVETNDGEGPAATDEFTNAFADDVMEYIGIPDLIVEAPMDPGDPDELVAELQRCQFDVVTGPNALGWSGDGDDRSFAWQVTVRYHSGQVYLTDDWAPPVWSYVWRRTWDFERTPAGWVAISSDSKVSWFTSSAGVLGCP